MPGPNPPEPANEEMKSLLVEMWPLIPAAVRRACHSLEHHPDQMELDGLASRITLLLMDNDFHTLRSFTNRSKPQTWLYTIARRLILHRIQEQGGKVSLDDLSPDSLVSQSNQEEKLFAEEIEKLLLAAVSKLTAREQELFSLIRQGLKPGEVAKVMGIKRSSVDNETAALKKKLRRIIRDK